MSVDPSNKAALGDIASLVAQINDAYTTLSKLEADPNHAVSARSSLVAAARQLATAAQSPHEAAMSIALGNALYPCILSAYRCGLLKDWPQLDMTTAQLADMTSSDRRLVGPVLKCRLPRAQVRIMRALAVSGIFMEIGEDRYSHNFLSKALCNPGLQTTLGWMSPGLNKMPEYLTLTSFRNPGSDDECATLFQYANQTPLSFYEALAANEPVRQGFDTQMAAHIATERARYASGFAGLWDFEGMISPLINSENDIAIVDVGGSKGHVLEDVRRCLPGLKGRLVLEELPSTLDRIEVPAGIEAVAYNFLLDEQPIKRAAVYLFRQIFLNWSDARAKKIIYNTIPALDGTKSRLLIMEPVLPAVDPPFQPVMLDMQMMQMGGGLRTCKEWETLLADCGLEVKNFWPARSNQTIIEAVRKRP